MRVVVEWPMATTARTSYTSSRSRVWQYGWLTAHCCVCLCYLTAHCCDCYCWPKAHFYVCWGWLTVHCCVSHCWPTAHCCVCHCWQAAYCCFVRVDWQLIVMLVTVDRQLIVVFVAFDWQLLCFSTLSVNSMLFLSRLQCHRISWMTRRVRICQCRKERTPPWPVRPQDTRGRGYCGGGRTATASSSGRGPGTSSKVSSHHNNARL